jgi:hypothetical protein
VKVSCWVIVSECIVGGHIFEELADLSIEEALEFFVIELRVDEDGADVGFRCIGKVLQPRFSIWA